MSYFSTIVGIIASVIILFYGVSMLNLPLLLLGLISLISCLAAYVVAFLPDYPPRI